MKTTLLKLGMPLMAFLMAIVFAFATENKTSDHDAALITGYILQNDACVPVPKDCNNIDIIPCEYLGSPVYAMGETTCNVRLFHKE